VATNALRQRITGLLQAQTLCRRFPALTGKRVDTRRLARIETGEIRLFAHEVAGLATDTAVQILVDRSGSMGAHGRGKAASASRPIEVARSACYAAAVALTQVPGVTVAVAAFPGNAEQEVAVLVKFGQRIDREASRFASLEAHGGTPMAEAMLWGAKQLLGGEGKVRRILLVTTDGEYDESLGRAMMARLDAAGIEAMGIGIHCDVSHLFARSRRIASIAQLPQAMFELLLEAMRSPMLTNYDRQPTRRFLAIRARTFS